MYHKGDLKTVRKAAYPGPSYDAREDSGYDEGFLKFPLVYLPHSCGQWVIGGPENIKALIADLQKALSQLEKT